MSNYYSKKLSAERLKEVYEIGSPRINQYLEAEINHILKKIKPCDTVIELGCGYGRIVKSLLSKAKKVVGVDISLDNINMAKDYLKEYKNVKLLQMDVGNVNYDKEAFDVTIVAQNGISAFKVKPEKLLRNCLQITKRGGIILFSTYSDKFWSERLKWFEKQVEKNLLAEIDKEKTSNGNIICKDGFTATTFTKDDFIKLTKIFNITPHIVEIDESSLFCEIIVP